MSERRLSAEAANWDAQAAAFDDETDHGLRDPGARRAWADRLHAWLPPACADVADLGCGTGSLSVLLAEGGHRVTGLDLSPEMLRQARRKAERHRVDVALVEGDAADPALPPASYDVVLCRHVLWALPDPAAALARWRRLLRPGGRLVLVEGRWATGGGLTADEVRELLRPLTTRVEVQRLEDPALWGRRIEDERYVVLAY